MSGVLTFSSANIKCNTPRSMANSDQSMASVSILIDAKYGMAGPKINEVSQAVRDIITSAPAFVKFDVNVFKTKLKKLISEKKPNVNLNELCQNINANCGSVATFYDGLGLVLNEIPYTVTESDYFHLLVFTYGNDSSSMIYNLDSVINLLNQKLIRNTKLHCTFIQAGPNSVVIDALQSKCTTKDRCVLIKVEDSEVGIRLGFNHVKTTLQTKLMQLSPYGRVEAQLQSLSLGGVPNPAAVIYQPHPVHPILPTPSAVNYQPVTPTAFVQPQVISNCNRIQPQRQPKNSFKIWVGNIPMVTKGQLQDFLQQWGPCQIETLNGNPTQWAVVAYNTEKAAEFAVKYGNRANFQGQILSINKI